MGIRRYIGDKEEIKKMKTNKIEVQEMQIDQTTTKNEPPEVVNDEKFNLKNYLHLKRQLIHSLEQHTTFGVQKCARKPDLEEMLIQEIDLLTQMLGK